MITGIVKKDNTIGKYRLWVGGQDTGMKSGDRDYFEYHNKRGTIAKLTALNITRFEYDDAMSFGAPGAVHAHIMNKPEFSINDKFRMMDELVRMTITGSSKAMLITGRGGIGKTFTVLQALAQMGKTDFTKASAQAAEAEAVDEDDTDDEIEEKVDNWQVHGDYVVFKGYVTAAALYRVLYEHKNRIVVFDDCDKVLRDENAINLLKGALDTYEERWISWNTQSFTSDLPQSFKFEGQIIFISNMEMEKIDEAIRTRCFKIDIGMTPAQRIERMTTVLPSIMPEVDLAAKLEALELMNEFKDVAKDISFRALMNVIKVRIEPAISDWKQMATYLLTQG